MANLTTWAKVGRVGFAPTMLKSHDFTDRCVTDSAHLPRYPSFLLFCVEKGEPTRLRRDGLEPSTLAHEASKLPLLYPAVSDRRLELHSLN